jgi:uncharacterized membrane protein
MPNWRILAAVVVMAGYAAISYVLMTYWPAQWWSVVALFGPVLVGMALGGIVQRQPRTLVACAALIGALALTLYWGISANQLYVLQHAAIHLVLAWTFGITLRADSKPLITAMAELVHDVFSPAQRAYTRSLTAVWVAYFLGMIVLSLAIYLLAPWSVWSLFCNLLTPVFAAALFVGEHLLRYRLHPEFERVTMAQVVRAYQSMTAPR